MILNEIIEKDYASKDDLTVDLAKAIEEHNELQKDFDEVKAEKIRLEEEVNSLKAKNLELLSMIPVIVDTEETEEVEETEEIKLEDILEEDIESEE